MKIFLNRKLMMRRFDRLQCLVTVQQTRRVVNTTRRKIGSGVPEGLGRCARHRTPHCGANAGKSVHGTMM
jgi:hypothetical protein